MPILYIVATPIGNLEDVTLRALRILKDVSLIAAEDTRITKRLLQHYNIRTSVTSYNEANSSAKTPKLLKCLEGEDLALVSDAGTPGIRDPGRKLVQAVVQAGFGVISLPGPSAVTTAVAASGLPSEQYLFLGFLPSRPKDRRAMLAQSALEPYTNVIFEAPHRLRDSLQDMESAYGPARPIVICRELTKFYEEVYRGTLSGAISYFKEPRGEFTLVIAGRDEKLNPNQNQMQEMIQDLRSLKQAGAPVKEALAWMARHHGSSRREMYKAWLALEDCPC